MGSRHRLAALVALAALSAALTVAAAKDEEPRKTQWTSLFAELWKPGEDQKALDAIAAFAAEWKLEAVVPAPGSAVQKAYVHGPFEGTFYLTVMLAAPPTVSRPSLLVKVALGPKSAEDEKTLDRFLGELKHRLRKVLASPVYSKTTKKLLPPAPEP